MGSHRTLLFALLLLAAGCAPLPSSRPILPSPSVPPSTVASPPLAPQATLVELATGLRAPVDLVALPDGRLLVAEQEGRLTLLDTTDLTRPPRSVADLRTLVRSGGEQGLLGLALHPRFGLPVRTPQGIGGIEARLYLNYTRADDGATVIAVAELDLARGTLRSTPRSLLVIEQPYANHNAGDLVFRADGLLVVPTGDGGAGGDPENRAQDPTSRLGKLLLLDVERATGGGIEPRIWASGLRNPWRVAVDPRDGALWIVDVGQSRFEEVNRITIDTPDGANFGWRIIEGTRCFDRDPCSAPSSYLSPVGVYDHGDGGCSIIGGDVARDPRGVAFFVFTDWCDGRLRAIAADQSGGDPERSVLEIGVGRPSLSAIVADRSGRLLALDHGAGSLLAIELRSP